MNNTKPRSNLILAVLALCIVALYILTSCDFSIPNYDTSFYAQNTKTKEFYKVKANKLVEGEKCVIWAEVGSGVTKTDAMKIAGEYDTVIRPRIVDAFSEKDFTVIDSRGKQHHFNDILDYANWFVGGEDRKLTILLLDIKDSFTNWQTDSYVAGYFYSGDFLSKKEYGYSNERDMIYIDTYPGLRRMEQSYATFAHELQHLINCATMIHIGRKKFQDTWIDEGLSSQAEYLYMGRNPEDKCEWFSNKKNGAIAKGNNFFVWDNHEEEPLAILDDYATVYLFFRWLYLQANAEQKSRLFREIIASEEFDYRAVTNVASKINSKWADWETLLRTWFAANYAPSNAVYGYKGDSYLQEGYGSTNPEYKGIRVSPIGDQTVSLYPGEGVYSIINHSFSITDEDPIRYAGLMSNGTITGTSSPYSGNMLLTFNADTNESGTATGHLTGVPPPVSASVDDTLDISRTAGTSVGPYVIDARDLLGRERTFSPADLQPLR